jgi:hypothetical protein
VNRVLRAEVKMMIRCEILYRQEDEPRVDHKNVGRCSDVKNAASQVASLSWVDMRNPKQESVGDWH